VRIAVRPPNFLRRLGTDEYAPRPYTPADRRVVAATVERLTLAAEQHNVPGPLYAQGRTATAAGLLELNRSAGETFFRVPDEAVDDHAAAMAAFARPEPVIDVQTHYLAPHASMDAWKTSALHRMYSTLMPEWWTELDDIVAFTAADYIRNVFIECETAVAVLTSGPGLEPKDRALFNDEIFATKALVEEFAGPNRLLNHVVVHADVAEEMAAMEWWAKEFDPVGWKVYTPGRMTANGWVGGWMLDDEQYGFPFLQRARDLGVNLVCAHKGISAMVDNGSPRDIGPAARAFPDLNFVIYHSGYEFGPPFDDSPAEGPYTEASAHAGVNRLITTAADNGIGRGGNIYAELGTTWFSVLRRPREAAHLLGKLLTHFGPDNVIWGTDSIWYGSAQPLIDAFRCFQIPDDMCAEFGYEPLTDEVKAKILAGNAARLYDIDLDFAREISARDDTSWARRLVADQATARFPEVQP
jgi:predicted TIM-barrel fold metal-dependent hydrolase